jgi:hypothetical protein
MWPPSPLWPAHIGLAPTGLGPRFVRSHARGHAHVARRRLSASAISLGIGIAYGAVAGYVGGRLDQFMMRFVEVLSGLPLIFFVIFLTVVFGRSQYLLFA